MSYHDYEITTADTNTGSGFREAVNNALQALASTSANYATLTETYMCQLWADLQNDLLKMRNKTDTAWIVLGSITSSWANEYDASYINDFINSKGDPSGLASLDANGRVVEQPASISQFLDSSANGSNGCTTRTITSDVFYDHVASGSIGGITASIRLDDWLATNDTTYNNVSTSKHGLMPKADGNVAHFYNGTGGQTAPDHGLLGGLTDDDHPQYISHSDFAANQMLACNTNGAAITFTVAEQTLVGRATGGSITALTGAQVNTLLGIGDATSIALGAVSVIGNHQNGVKITMTAGETLPPFSTCYIKSDGKLWLADADSSTTAPALYLSPTAQVAAEGTGDFLKFGIAKNASWGSLVIGSMMYLSPTAGGVTATVPVTTGQIVQPIGYALTTNTIDFSPIFSFVKLA